MTQKNLNPDAPEFTPTSPLSPLSPEMMKTPEGHVKVTNWAEEMKTPTSGDKNASFKSASPVSNEGSPSGQEGIKGTSESLPRRIEKDFVSPNKDEQSENEGSKEKDEKSGTDNSQKEKIDKDSCEEESKKTDIKESENAQKGEQTSELVEGSSGDTIEEKNSSVEETAKEEVEVTAEEGEETSKQMAKSEIDSDSKEGSSEEVEKVTQESTGNVESNTEGPEGDKKVSEEGKNVLTAVYVGLLEISFIWRHGW